MLNIPPVPEQVEWFEGMLLSPQHFQQNSIYLENLQSNHLARVSPHFWGLLGYTLNRPALGENKLKLDWLYGVMRDGSVVDYPADDGDSPEDLQPELSIELDKLDNIKAEEPFYICVSLARLAPGCASDNNTELQRYDSVKAGLTLDLGDVNNGVTITRLRPLLRLGLETDLNKNYAYFRVAKLKRTHEGAFDLLEYTPPSLFLSQASPTDVLGSRIKESLDAVRDKADGIRRILAGGGELEMNYQATLMRQLTVLMAQLPQVELAFYGGKSHPEQVYQALVSLAAAVSTIDPAADAPPFTLYDHDNMDRCFDEARARITRVLKTIPLNLIPTEFEGRSDGTWRGEVTTTEKVRTVTLSLGVRAGVSKEDLEKWFLAALVCRENDHAELQRQRVIGIKGRQRETEFEAANRVESASEIFYQIDLAEYEAGDIRIVIEGTRSDMDRYSPLFIKCLSAKNSEPVD